jgi:hypothetical protein
MEKNIPVRNIRKLLTPRRNIDVLRTYYCYQLGSTFARLGLMESTIMMAIATCDRIRFKALQNDVPAVKYVAERHSHLKRSTLGRLIAILAKHGVTEADLAYLKWVKERRNFFIHHFFNNYAWPGNLGERSIRVLCRRLRYLEYIFARADAQIYKILSRAGLMHYIDLGEDGALFTSVGAFVGEDSWLEDLVIAETHRHARARRNEHPRRAATR